MPPVADVRENTIAKTARSDRWSAAIFTPSDAETQRLIRACKQGNEAAWEALVRHYQPVLYRFAYAYCRNHEDAGDIVGEVWLRLYQHLPNFQENACLTSWLWRIVRNTFISYCIRSKHRTHLSLETGLERYGEPADGYDLPDPAPSPETLCLASASSRELARAIRYLPVLQRQLFTMYYTESKSYQEISQASHLPVGTVKSRLHRARRMLREALADSELMVKPELPLDRTSASASSWL